MKPFRVVTLEETPSTNLEIKRALDAGEAEGLVVRARRQVAGYGRQGRAWASPEGGLYCSLLLRPSVDLAALPTLSLVVGIAVRRAVVSLIDVPAAQAIQIKWPNDVVLAQGASRETSAQEGSPEWLAQKCRYARFSADDKNSDLGFSESEVISCAQNRAQRHFCASEGAGCTPESVDGVSRSAVLAKLCGISLEAHGGGVCVGVGVNVVPPAERPDVGGKNRAAYVNDLIDPSLPSVSIEDVLEAFLAAFAPLYDAWASDGFAPLVDEFNAHASLIGRSVSVVDRAGATLSMGTVERVDAWGRLLLRDETGAEIPVSSGEAHLA